MGSLLERLRRALEVRGLILSTLAEPQRNGMRYAAWLSRDASSSLRIEVSTRTPFWHAYVQTEGMREDTLLASVAVPGLAIWLGVNAAHGSWVRDWVDAVGGGRETGVSVHLPDVDDGDVTMHWHVHAPTGSWSRETPRWRDGSVNFTELLLGERKYTSHVVEDKVVSIPMPERSYRWRIKLCDDVWTRPRWPWDFTLRRAHCDALKGEQIPFPGKGENDFDCDSDASYGLTMPAHSVADAVGKIVGDVTETRYKRGWRGPPKRRKANGSQPTGVA